jgi:hypothetical protein
MNYTPKQDNEYLESAKQEFPPKLLKTLVARILRLPALLCPLLRLAHYKQKPTKGRRNSIIEIYQAYTHLSYLYLVRVIQ